MKKINNKGFLLVETLIVATFCLSVLVILFLQFKNLVVSYNNSYKYNTVEGIYSLKPIKNYLTQNDFSTQLNLENTNYKLITSLQDEGVVCNNSFSKTDGYCNALIEDGNFKTIIYTKNYKLDTLKNEKFGDEGLENFIRQIKNQEKENRLIAQFNDGTYATISY